MSLLLYSDPSYKDYDQTRYFRAIFFLKWADKNIAL